MARRLTPIAFVVDALAVARLTRLVREDYILDRPRHWLIVHERHSPWFKVWIKCPWCVSIWCGFLVAAGRRFTPAIWEPVGEVLAASYCTAMLAVHLEPKPDE